MMLVPFRYRRPANNTHERHHAPMTMRTFVTACLFITIITGCSYGNKSGIANEHRDLTHRQLITHHYYGEMLSSLENFLESLTPTKRDAIVYPFTDAYRTRGFCYVLAHCKEDFAGLRMQDLTTEQKTKLNSVLMKLLSSAGYSRATGIMNREWLLQEMENAHRAYPLRYPAIGSQEVPNWVPPPERGGPNFYVALFGDPMSDSTWGIRFEGHHLSLNYTFGENGDHINVGFAPIFFGSSPMSVPQAPDHTDYPLWSIQEGQQLLKREAWLARSFLASLSNKMRQQGEWSYLPGAELAGGTSVSIHAEDYTKNQGEGIWFDQLDAMQRSLLLTFIEAFTDTSHFGAPTQETLVKAMQAGRIWWHGDWKNEEGAFYFRVESDRYLVEILQSNTFGITSNVQANHVHAALRDLKSDWDFDVLQDHINHAH